MVKRNEKRDPQKYEKSQAKRTEDVKTVTKLHVGVVILDYPVLRPREGVYKESQKALH